MEWNSISSSLLDTGLILAKGVVEWYSTWLDAGLLLNSGIGVGWNVDSFIDRFRRCSVRDCGVTEGLPAGADLTDLLSKLSENLGNFPSVVLGASRVDRGGELGVSLGGGIMVLT